MLPSPKARLLPTRSGISSVLGSSTLMNPGSSPLGDTSTVPSAAVVPIRANRHRSKKSIDCSSSAVGILARVVGRGSAMMRRNSSGDVRRAMVIPCESCAPPSTIGWDDSTALETFHIGIEAAQRRLKGSRLGTVEAGQGNGFVALGDRHDALGEAPACGGNMKHDRARILGIVAAGDQPLLLHVVDQARECRDLDRGG